MTYSLQRFLKLGKLVPLLYKNAVQVPLLLWEGDDEFPAEANILFDELCGKILSPEDADWLAGMLIYRLIALSYR